MATYTVNQQRTTPVTGMTGNALSRDAAVVAAIAAAPGPTGREVAVMTCDLVSASGPTGTYSTTYQTTQPLTGSTFSAVSREDAIAQAVAAGPTGPGAGIDIWQTN